MNDHFKLRYSSEFAKAPAIRWQIDMVLPLGGVTVLHGPPKTFKTYIAQSMALSCASGLPWQGLPTRPATVLYIGPEGFFGLIRRQRAWEQSNSQKDVPVAYWPVPVNFYQKMSIEEALTALREQGCRPDFIVIDTLQRASVGADENSVKDMGQVFDNLNLFLGKLADPETGRAPTCLIIHHDTKAGGAFRGSTSIFGAVDGMLSAERRNEDTFLCCDAFREGEPFSDLRMVFHGAVNVATEDGWQTEIAVRAHLTQQDRFDELVNTPAEKIQPPKWSSDQQKVLEVLERGPARFTDLARETGLNNPRVKKAIDALIEAGQINKGEGRNAREGMYMLNGTIRPIQKTGMIGTGLKPPYQSYQLPIPKPIEPIVPNQSYQSDPAPAPAEPLPADTVYGTNTNRDHNIAASLRSALDDSDLEYNRLAESPAEPDPEASSTA